MDRKNFNAIIKKCEETIRRVRNDSSVERSYLDRILYWLTSKMYMEGVREDVCLIERLLRRPSLILDFGTGIGYLAAILSTLGNSVEAIDTILDKSIEQKQMKYNVDRNESLSKVWKELRSNFENLNFQFYDGKNIPFGDNNFDIVLGYAVLEHIPNEEIDFILDEINRVLKPEGFFYTSRLPRKEAILEYLVGTLKLGRHEILIDEKAFKNRLNEHGFKVLQCSRQDMFPMFPAALWNPVSPFLSRINRILLKTPLSYLSHNSRVIAQERAL